MASGFLDPATIGLLSASGGLLSAGGPSRTPTSFGQALGQGLNAGLSGYQQGQQGEMQNMLRAAQMKKMQEEEEERKRKAAAMVQLAQDPRFAQYGSLLQVSPQTAIDRVFPKDNKPLVVGPGASLVDPEKPQKPLYSTPSKPQPPSGLAQLIAERDALPAGHPNRALYDDAVKKASVSTPLVNVDNRQGSEFDKAVGKEMGEVYSNLLKADLNAPNTIGKYNRLGSLLGEVNTGKFKGTTTDIKASAKSLGLDLNAMGVTDDVAPAQAARALSNQMALELRNPAGGAGMPGAMSDQDRNFLTQMVPNLENDPGAVNKMIEYRVKLAQREQKVAKMARDYRKKNGKFDEGFFDELSAWSAKNHLFDKETSSAAVGISPATRSLLDKYAPQ